MCEPMIRCIYGVAYAYSNGVDFVEDDDNVEKIRGGFHGIGIIASKVAKNKPLIKFKLASNLKLKQNLKSQLDIYKKAAQTDKEIKVICVLMRRNTKGK